MTSERDLDVAAMARSAIHVRAPMPARAPDYILRHTDHELRRLTRQHGLFGAFTRSLLVEAGIGRGMRVLDIGTGAGDVALLAAEIVGPGGAVVGIDVSAAGVDRARERATADGYRNTTFVAGDAMTLALDGEFDAAVGRFVLAWAADPVRLVDVTARRVRRGGVVAFQEFDHPIRQEYSFPDAPLFERTFALCLETLRRAGFALRMGAGLFQTLTAAGLPAPRVRMEASVGGGPDFAGYEWLAESVRSLLPRMIALGVVGEGELEVDTLAERVRDEVVSGGGTISLAPMIGAWSTRL
jgi:ubiquinone/menaquinone biosynthesis C-methylase UbiE